MIFFIALVVVVVIIGFLVGIRFLTQYATNLYERGEYGKVIDITTRAMRVLSFHNYLLIIRAQAYSRLGYVQQMMTDYNNFIEKAPNHYLGFNNRGFERSKRGDLNGGLKDCDRAVALNPGVPSTWSNRGHVYFLQGYYDEALIDFEQALGVDQNHIFAWAGMAICQYKNGDIDSARDSWEHALTLNAQLHDPNTFNMLYCPATEFMQVVNEVAQLVNGQASAKSNATS